jgi:predicted PurR-regulated permease PerM
MAAVAFVGVSVVAGAAWVVAGAASLVVCGPVSIASPDPHAVADSAATAKAVTAGRSCLRNVPNATPAGRSHRPEHAPCWEPVSSEERVVSVRPRTIFTVLGISLLVGVVLWVIWLSRGVVGWILIAVFLAMALNPAVEFFERRGAQRSRAAVLVSMLALLVIGGLSYLLIPPLVDQIRDFAAAVPELVQDLTEGEGPLGFLEREYQIVARIREVIEGEGIGGILGFTGAGLSIARGVLTAVIGVVTIAFLTLFLLLDGRRLVGVVLGYVPARVRPRWQRTVDGIYRTVAGYVTGNVVISVIAGLISTAVLFATGMPYAVTLGVLVALFDLVPLAGATIAAIIVILVALATEGLVIAIILAGFFLVYQQVENHVLQPLIYGRTVQISPVIVLVSILIGADLAGVLGALVAIPIAGSLQVILAEVTAARSERAAVVNPPP